VTRYSTTTSPVEALRLDEIARTRVFLKVALLTSLLAIIPAAVTTGDPVAFRVVIAGCAMTSIGAIWMLSRIRDIARYSPRRIAPPALIIAFGAFAGVYYWGVGSPVAAMLVYGIYFFSLGGNARIVTAMYGLVAGLHALMGFAIVTGVIADRGIVNISNL